MKTIYYKINGRYRQIEVSDEVAMQYHEIEKEEDKLQKRQNRHGSLWTVEDYEEETGNAVEGSMPSPEEILIAKESKKQTRQALKYAIGKLLPEQRALIEKIYIKGLSQDEIAKSEGVVKSAISNRMSRIYTQLRKNIEDFQKKFN